MSQTVALELLLPDDMAGFRLPPGVDARLARLLARQDAGERLSKADRDEAAGLVELAEMIALLRLRAARAGRQRLRPRT